MGDLRRFRSTIICWYGPFSLSGRPTANVDQDPTRLGEFDEPHSPFGKMSGVYFFVGRQGKLPLHRRRILYFGKTNSSFLKRFRQHLDPNDFVNGGDERKAKLYLIEKHMRLDSIWLGVTVSCLEAPVGRGETEDNEIVFIQVCQPLLNRKKPAPMVSTLIRNQFDETTWKAKGVSSWRPAGFPLLIEHDVKDGGECMIWTNTQWGMRCKTIRVRTDGSQSSDDD
jgi:hypothetical protein